MILENSALNAQSSVQQHATSCKSVQLLSSVLLFFCSAATVLWHTPRLLNNDKDAARPNGTEDWRAPAASPTRPAADNVIRQSGAAASDVGATAAAASGAAASAAARAGAAAARVRVEQLDALLIRSLSLSSLSFAYLSGNYHRQKSDKVHNKTKCINNYLREAQE